MVLGIIACVLTLTSCHCDVSLVGVYAQGLLGPWKFLQIFWGHKSMQWLHRNPGALSVAFLGDFVVLPGGYSLDSTVLHKIWTSLTCVTTVDILCVTYQSLGCGIVTAVLLIKQGVCQALPSWSPKWNFCLVLLTGPRYYE